ncbi:MAG: hypothetical protein WD557_07215 [Dehalococcoidia bacterium]
MTERAATEKSPDVEGVAGYLSPYPYLDVLQEKMEERLARRVPAAGRFCGFCYGRLRQEDAVCPFCTTSTEERATVSEIPQEALKAYHVKSKTEARWVHTGAFVGLLVASALFLWLVLWAPGFLGHPALALAVLVLGSYPLAQLFGPLIFGQIGYRKGARKRDRLWAEHLKARGD